MSEPSPRPWEIQTDAEGKDYNCVAIWDQRGECVYDCDSGLSVSDAQFIVRAVNAHDDLKLALIGIRSVFEVHCKNPAMRLGLQDMTRLIQSINAALAKAKGEKPEAQNSITLLQAHRLILACVENLRVIAGRIHELGRYTPIDSCNAIREQATAIERAITYCTLSETADPLTKG